LPRPSSDLDGVLVVTVRKSFWASPEAERFPWRLYAHVLFGHSTSVVNAAVVYVRALAVILLRRPRIVLLGSVERTVPWFIRARRSGMLGHARLVVTNQLHLSDEQLRFVDRNIVYSQAWIDAQRRSVQDRAVFAPLPADGDFGAFETTDEGYVFAGGGAGRDFATLIEAMRGRASTLRIVTFGPETLGWAGPLPDNVEVEWTMPLHDFLQRMAGARIVVVPLRDGSSDFGQTTLVQGLALGKPTVATRTPGVIDYIDDGHEGLLVDAGDVAGYREALRRLEEDVVLRQACSQRARERAQLSTYSAFANRLETVLRSIAARDVD
jgi:glycosyltransferase involved in cell wall biosynthesis